MNRENQVSVLFVCMGNICRSPTAEGVFRHLLAAIDLQVAVDSAGTHSYHIGKPPDRRAQATAARHGVDLSALRARRVEPGDLDRFELILAMDNANLAELEQLQARHGGRAQIARLLDYAAGGEVPDPYYGPGDGFQRVYETIEAGCRGLLKAILGGPGAPANGRP